MAYRLTSATDKLVDGSEAVLLVRENDGREILNLWAGDHDLWYGDENVKSGTIGGKVDAEDHVELKTRSAVYVIRQAGEESKCSYSQEFKK